jgi:hypothetical protein
MSNQNKRSVIVYGPKACGKTRNAELLRRHLGLEHVLDDWYSHQRVPPFNTLVLTSDFSYRPAFLKANVECVSFADAIKRASGA